MTAKKVMVFLAGATPTTNEQAEIDKWNALASPGYEIHVRKGDVAADANYGYGKEAADYAVVVSPMTKPTAYSAVTTAIAAAPPSGGNMASTMAIWSSGQKYAGCTVTGSGTFATPTIVNGVVTGIVLSSS